jgi:hypothetical protein
MNRATESIKLGLFYEVVTALPHQQSDLLPHSFNQTEKTED